MDEIILKNLLGKDVKIILVDNQDEADFITHNGTFHADEVMSTCLLANLSDEIHLCRTNNVINTEAFVYDIGLGEFDHHGLDFDKERTNGIKYASCGLIWNRFANQICDKLNILDKESFILDLDKELIMDIDRDDNGQSINISSNIKLQNIPSLIASFNPNWDELDNENKCFMDALLFANTILNNIANKLISKEKARVIIEKKIEESENGILVLDCYMPWKEIVLTSNNKKAKDIYYAVFPSKRGGYNVVATPKCLGSFELKKAFPSIWAGKEKEELREITGIETINFCHKNAFICACETYKDALKIAELAIKSK